MPLIIYMKNGIQFPVKGETIIKREWRGDKMVSKTTMNGNAVMVAAGAVAMVELIGETDYAQMVEARTKAAEDERIAQAGRIARPGMIIPGRRQ